MLNLKGPFLNRNGFLCVKRKEKSMDNSNEIIKELQKDVLNPELIKDNKYPFYYNKKEYRIVMPTQQDLNNASTYRNNVYVKLLQQEGTVTLKQLIKILKEKQDIDIEKIDKEIEQYNNDYLQAHLSLAKQKDTNKQSIEDWTNKINDLRDKKLELILERAQYLAPAIENQAQDAYYQYLTAYCTEVCDKENEWDKVWNSIKIYEDDRTKLANIALGHLTELAMTV